MRTVSLAAIGACVFASAACTAVLGISDPIDEGALPAADVGSRDGDALVCVAGASPCSPPPVSCETVTCDEASHTCPTKLTDVDGDGHGPSSTPVAAPCDDCDDVDKNAFPGQTKYFTAARVGGGFDY